jgi:RNA polymerase sigma factor (sigma-70 family)
VLRSEDNITELIKGCISNNQECIRKIYAMYSKKMYTLCVRYITDSEEARDVMQEGFIKVFEKIKSYSFKGSFEGWIRRIMIYTSIDHLRNKVSFQSLSECNSMESEFDYNHILDDITSKEIFDMIQGLTTQCRTVFNLFAIEGYSHKEIAQLLGITEGASKANYFRARSVLREKLSNSKIEAKLKS